MRGLFLAIAGVVLVGVSMTAAQTPLGSAFTYQGRLEALGSPLTDYADFQFSLWNAPTGGSQVGSTVSRDSVTVEEGLFTVQLDFGVTVFDGDARWLEIGVRSPAGSGGFTTLSPRQPLTASPYSLQTRGIFVDQNLRVGVGTTAPEADLHVAGQVKITGGSPAAGKVLTADSTGLGSWQTVSGAVPSGAIMFFNLPACPQGWSEFALGRGRYLVGLTPGGQLLATVGNDLNDQEDRPTGQHRHYGSYYRSNVSGGVIPGTGSIIAVALRAEIQRYQQDGTVSEVQGTNAPYVQCLVCVKD